ncbi:MAG: hypothetical protein ACUVRJ_05050 [Candidatus Villigracilaceae bacterium]
MTAEGLRALLIAFLVIMYLLAIFYLRRRKLSPGAYIFWGLLALLLPALGSFLVILARPGENPPRPKFQKRIVR